MGLMSSFLSSLSLASEKAGGALKEFIAKEGKDFEKARERLREYRLFAKQRSKEQKDRMVAGMVALVEKVQSQLGKTLKAAAAGKSRLAKHGKIAHRKIEALHAAMRTLTPQIRYWLQTGFVAAGKLVSVHVPELYSVVRGKVGKKVEFGLSWGVRRLRGGFLLATLAKGRKDLVDPKFAVSAVDEHVALFGKAPDAYGYDRGGWSYDNIAALKRRGVKHVGLAPQGKAKWQVSGKIREKLVSERAQVEGGIGTIKHQKYGFNRPAARTARMMGACGQLAVLGFNLNKMIRGLAQKRDVGLVG
jgi:hypothetical protein